MQKIIKNFTFYVLLFTFYVLPSKVHAQSAVGNVSPPLNNSMFNLPNGAGLFLFISNIFNLAGTIAGIIFIFQMIFAGYAYMSANGDVKKVEQSTNKIIQSALGMVVVASAFVIAAIIERFTGLKILNPVLYGPN